MLHGCTCQTRLPLLDGIRLDIRFNVHIQSKL